MQRNRLLSDVGSDAVVAKQKTEESKADLDFLLSGEIYEELPDALQPFHKASKLERDRRVRDVLRTAWRIYSKGGVSMVDAIAGVSAGAECEYAKISLRRILLELNLNAWESHPARTRDDVHRLFRKAIGRLTPHRGGWRVAR